MSPFPEAPGLAAGTRWVAKAREHCFLFALTLGPGEVLVLQPMTVHQVFCILPLPFNIRGVTSIFPPPLYIASMETGCGKDI